MTATGSTINQSTFDWTVSGLTTGTKYYVYAKISDGTHTRFLYLSNEFDVVLNTNVENYDLKNYGISIYPNPTTNIINLSVSNSKEIIKAFKISDVNGKTILERTNIQQNEIIDLSFVKSGIYFINIQTAKEIFTTKILKE